MSETISSVVTWADETFGRAHGLARILARINEEASELGRAVTTPAQCSALEATDADGMPIGFDRIKVGVELADIAIILCRPVLALGANGSWLTATDGAIRLVDRPHPAKAVSVVVEDAGRLLAKVLRATADGFEVDSPTEIPRWIIQSVSDFAMAVHDAAASLGLNLWTEVEAKMETNRAREWKRDGTGHGYHLRPATGALTASA